MPLKICIGGHTIVAGTLVTCKSDDKYVRSKRFLIVAACTIAARRLLLVVWPVLGINAGITLGKVEGRE